MARKNSSNPLIYLSRMMWYYGKKERLHIKLYVVLFFLAQAVSLLVPPYLMGRATQVLIERPANWFELECWLLAGTVLAEFVFWLFHGPARIIERTAAYSIGITYQKHLYEGVLTLPMKWHRDHDTGDTLDRINKGGDALEEYADGSYEVLYMIISFVGAFLAIFRFSGGAASAVVFMALVLALVIMRFDAIIIPLMKTMNRMHHEVSAKVTDVISNISTVLTLRVERQMYQMLAEAVESPKALARKESELNEWKWFVTSLICSLMAAVAVGYYFLEYYLRSEVPKPGDFVMLWQFLDKMSNAFRTFTLRYGTIIKRHAGVTSSEELVAQFVQEKLTNHVLSSDWREIDVKDLSFTYDEEKERVHLDSIALSFRRGEHIALVGTSGCGKSTTLKLLGGVEEAQSLELRINGDYVREGIAGICRAITLVQQETEIYKGSVRENVTMNVPCSDADIMEALDIAQFLPVLAELPRGLDSLVNEKGVNLSGGQKQRLALARGLLAARSEGKDILLLDEQTSNQDQATERLIWQELLRRYRDKLIVASVHRLAILPFFHRTVVFDKGRVVDSGTPAELRARCKRFQELEAKAFHEAVPVH